MFKNKRNLFKLILSVCMTVFLALFLYWMTKSLLAGILVSLFLIVYWICMNLCQKGMENMKGAEIFAVKSKLPRGALCGKALLYSAQVLLPFNYMYILPSFIPFTSFSAWAMIYLAFIIFLLLILHPVGEAYRDITGLRYPFYIFQAIIFSLLTVASSIINQVIQNLLK